MYGPDVTFLGVEGCDLDDPVQLKGAAAFIIGAAYDAGCDLALALGERNAW
jgi:agmatinase